MAATATRPEQVIGTRLGGGPGTRNGNGFHKNGGSSDRGEEFRFSPARYRLGAWAGVGSILMLFVALTSAYIVRSAASNDWRPVAMPKVLWLSTALILVSSVTIEAARRSLRNNGVTYGRWLLGTLVLGAAFVISQLVAWRQLVKQGVYLASNPYSSFFYLFTAAHGVHLLGGLGALTYLLVRTTKQRDTLDGELRRVGAADAASIYWHFLDALWIGLFLLLMFWK